MIAKKNLRSFFTVLLSFLILVACNPGDARKIPPNAKDRVQKNLEEGRGFRLMDSVGKEKGGTFDFSNFYLDSAFFSSSLESFIIFFNFLLSFI